MGLAAFEIYLDSVLALVGPHHLAAEAIAAGGSNLHGVTPYRVVWRGNTLGGTVDSQILASMDALARERTAAYGIPYIDTVATMKSTPGFPGCCTVTNVHIGSHEFYNYRKKRNAAMNWTMTSMVTNEVMRYICPLPQGV